MAWVYILSTESGKYYVGSTTDLDARLKHHFGGHTPSTLRLRPVALRLSQQYDSLEEARAIERKIKRMKRRDYIEKMLRDGYIRLRLRG